MSLTAPRLSSPTATASTQSKVDRLNIDLEALYALQGGHLSTVENAALDKRICKLEDQIDDLTEALDAGADFSRRGTKIVYVRTKHDGWRRR